jgi:hypothetical protein
MSFLISLLQSSHPRLIRTPILCSHFPYGNEHVITFLARPFLASFTALELIQEPRHSLFSPSRNRNSAAQVVKEKQKTGLLSRTRFNCAMISTTPRGYSRADER